ncbi:hypothetical protein C4577_07385 [Candidatus Parcubacteria bacterium]|nr:MAG: hypothetical protein C4577_07385 [Candidatus Parcubacteria bacterium]
MENTIESIREDLEYAINRTYLSCPNDCVPKSIIRQVIDAEAPEIDPKSSMESIWNLPTIW